MLRENAKRAIKQFMHDGRQQRIDG